MYVETYVLTIKIMQIDQQFVNYFNIEWNNQYKLVYTLKIFR